MERNIEVAVRHNMGARWNDPLDLADLGWEEAKSVLEALIDTTQNTIEQSRALIAKIDEILVRRL
jgi:hypothetical protein